MAFSQLESVRAIQGQFKKVFNKISNKLTTLSKLK